MRPWAKTRLFALGLGLASLAPSASPAAPAPASAARDGRPITSLDLLSLAEIGGYSGTFRLSPDGRRVALQVQRRVYPEGTYRIQWVVARTDGAGGEVPVGEGGELMLAPSTFGRVNGARADVPVRWSPDGKWIAYLRQDGGEARQVQVWRSAADGSKQEPVTHAAADVASFSWKPDGSGIFFRVGRERELMREADRREAERGYVLDDRFEAHYSTKPLWYGCGEQLWGAPPPESQKCTPTAWVADFGAPERRASAEEEKTLGAADVPARPPDVAAERKISGIAWDAKHARAAWLENEDPKKSPGFAAPLTLFAAGKRCPAPECHGQLRKAFWTPNGEEVILFTHEGHASSLDALYAWRPGASSARRILRLDGILGSCEMGAGGALVCLHETPTTPRKIVSIGLADGRVTTVFDPNPKFSELRLGAVEKLEWDDAFGNPCFGHLAYPPDYRQGQRYPLVVVQYRSRGFLKGGVGEEYPILPLAAAGFLVLSHDRPEDWDMITRHDGATLADLYAISAEEWKDGRKFRMKVTALERILDRLDARGVLDPARVGITGLSDGGETADYALFGSTRFAAAAHSGHWSPDYYHFAVGGAFRDLLRAQFGGVSGAEAIEKWKALSTTYHVDQVHAPLLIQVSDTELLANIPEFVAFRDAKKPIEVYVFPGEYHIKWQALHKLAVAERTVDWFRFWLKNEEGSDPKRADEYARWRAMRNEQTHSPGGSASGSLQKKKESQ